MITVTGKSPVTCVLPLCSTIPDRGRNNIQPRPRMKLSFKRFYPAKATVACCADVISFVLVDVLANKLAAGLSDDSDEKPPGLEERLDELYAIVDPISWVTVRVNGHKRSLSLTICDLMNLRQQVRQHTDLIDFTLFLGSKPLPWEGALGDYNITHGTQFQIKIFPLRGGSQQGSLIPEEVDYEVFSKASIPHWCESATERYKKRLRNELRSTNYHLQATGEDLTSITDFFSSMEGKVDEKIMILVEDAMIFAAQTYRARDKTDVLIAASVFIKARTARSLVSSSLVVVSKFITSVYETVEVQSSEDILHGVNSFRDFMSRWDELRDTTVVKKFSKVLNYMVAFGIFSSLDKRLPPSAFRKMEDIADRPFAQFNFAYCVVDAVTFTLQRVLMYNQTGDWSTFLHGPKTYADWFDKCLTIKREAYSLGNLEAQGTNYFTFVANLKDCIETGRSIVRFSSKENGAEFRAARQMLNDVLIIEANVLTKKSAQQERRAPLGILIHGGSSVAKSMFTKMLYYYYGKLMGLPTADEYKYTRNPADDYWSGFTSQMWCIQLDDIGYLHAAKASEDSSLMELIALVNNVPLVPNQAALEDKGRTPVRAKFVIATSNAKDLNASAYFHCPLAVQRRLPWVITVSPKPEYERSDAAGMIDPSKMVRLTDEWPNYWFIKVEKVVPGGKAGARDMATHEVVKEFSETKQFLDWFKDVVVEFELRQGSAMCDDTTMASFELCLACNALKHKCTCEHFLSSARPQIQARETLLPRGKIMGDTFTITSLQDGHLIEDKFECTRGQYYCTRTSLYKGVISKKVMATSVVQELRVQADPVTDYADVLDEILRVQNLRATTWRDKTCAYIVGNGLKAYFKYPIFKSCLDWTIQVSWVRALFCRALLAYIAPSEWTRSYFELVGSCAQRVYMAPKWIKALGALTIMGACALVYNMFVSSQKTTPVACVLGNVSEPDDENLQGTTSSEVTDAYFKRTARENVWVRNDYQTTTFEIDSVSANYAALDPDQAARLIRKNTARIEVYGTRNGVRTRTPANAFCVGGHLWVTNNHVVSAEGEVTLHFNTDPHAQGTTRNVQLKLTQYDFYRDVDNDMVWFELLTTNPRADLRRLISREALQGSHRAAYVGFTRECVPRTVSVRSTSKVRMHCASLNREFDYWQGLVQEDTVNGDCGSILVTFSPSVVILGIHQLGGAHKTVFALSLTQSHVDAARTHFKRPIIQSGAPKLSAPGAEKSIGELHHKSALRWIEEGTINAFGSYTGFINRPRSKVSTTLLGDTIKLERGYVIDYSAPDLKDWRPWNHALKDIVQQNHCIDSSVLDASVAAFSQDLIQGLSVEAKDTLRILSDYAAVNGIQGVRFVDKLNFNTSMGEPYNHSKKFHLHPAPTADLPDGKMFDEETMRRFRSIIEGYKTGVSQCPVFSGQLKDEPRPTAKVNAGKVRVFTGAPVDWSLVVRKYLLTFVKVVQENQLLFEAAPGCVAQSTEWQDFRKHITKFGDDRIIAGDYGKFDKKMSAKIILAAFDVIIAVLKDAGWSAEELLVVYGIAEDTAFSFANYNGDCLQFMGSNPSGHPLTVIVNSIVNALYMRYCYALLNPDQEVKSFKKNVALLTYGDDNVMGSQVDWFNHTAIVGVLAQIGVEYTMADKESKSVPFINIRDVSFLKRSWRWDSDVGAYLCPLEEASIQKMLCINIPSKTISDEDQMLEVMTAAVNEWFYYGKDKFTLERSYLEDLAERSSLGPLLKKKPFPTWEQLYERFWRASSGAESTPRA